MYMITFQYYDEMRHDRPQHDRIMTRLEPVDFMKAYYSDTGYEINILDKDVIDDRYTYCLQGKNYMSV